MFIHKTSKGLPLDNGGRLQELPEVWQALLTFQVRNAVDASDRTATRLDAAVGKIRYQQRASGPPNSWELAAAFFGNTQQHVAKMALHEEQANFIKCSTILSSRFPLTFHCTGLGPGLKSTHSFNHGLHKPFVACLRECTCWDI
mmetsp:Transcript_3126/g.8631  ORF Transcript_3126/g.8631 Transcript_3126/m.8631 type:complete len:144 (-) Transcript_3126:196-627(-)|eukprot:352743-Chlamydomonas_euryale.AAC.15